MDLSKARLLTVVEFALLYDLVGKDVPTIARRAGVTPTEVRLALSSKAYEMAKRTLFDALERVTLKDFILDALTRKHVIGGTLAVQIDLATFFGRRWTPLVNDEPPPTLEELIANAMLEEVVEEV